jgi:hypothetical protein
MLTLSSGMNLSAVLLPLYINAITPPSAANSDNCNPGRTDKQDKWSQVANDEAAVKP